MNNIDTKTIKKIIIILVVLVIIISATLICLNIFQNDNTNINELIDKYKVEDKDNINNDQQNNNENIETNQNNVQNNSNNSNKNESSKSNNIINNNSNNSSNETTSKNNNHYESSVKEQITATKEYYCIEDSYTLKNNKCYKTVSMDSTYRYTCSEGKLNVDVCEFQSIVEINYTSIAKELCVSLAGSGVYNSCLCAKSDGFFHNGKCSKIKDMKKNATKEYYCISSDYTLNKNDNKCYKTFELDAMYKYTCPNDYDNYGEICVKK